MCPSHPLVVCATQNVRKTLDFIKYDSVKCGTCGARASPMMHLGHCMRALIEPGCGLNRACAKRLTLCVECEKLVFLIPKESEHAACQHVRCVGYMAGCCFHGTLCAVEAHEAVCKDAVYVHQEAARPRIAAPPPAAAIPYYDSEDEEENDREVLYESKKAESTVVYYSDEDMDCSE